MVEFDFDGETRGSNRKQLISFVSHCNSSWQRLWNDMAHGGLPGDDVTTLVQFEAVKFEALLRELDLDLQGGDVSVGAVENASSKLIELQSKRASPEMKENLRELKGRVVEYEDWRELPSADAAQMLFERFHHLLMVLHMSNDIPSEVSLFSIDRNLAELRPKISRRRMTCLNMIYSDLQGWRQLVACGSEAFAQRNFFWSKLPSQMRSQAARPKSPARKSAARTRHQSSAATRRQEQSDHQDRTSELPIPGKSPAHTSRQPAAASRRQQESDKQPNTFEMPEQWRSEAARGTASRKDSRSYSASSESSGQRRLRPCDAAPHCADFEQKHGSTKKRKVDPSRREEYKYLYAAQAHCLQCLEYYGALSDFDLDCKSSGMNARHWAGIDESSKPCLIPDSIEQWLLSKNL